MKHLKKFNESVEDEKRDILDNFEFISDKFGEPDCYSSKYGDSSKWSMSWNIKLDLSVLQEAHQLIEKLKDIVEDIDDVLAASDRLETYNIMSQKMRIKKLNKMGT